VASARAHTHDQLCNVRHRQDHSHGSNGSRTVTFMRRGFATPVLWGVLRSPPLVALLTVWVSLVLPTASLAASAHTGPSHDVAILPSARVLSGALSAEEAWPDLSAGHRQSADQTRDVPSSTGTEARVTKAKTVLAPTSSPAPPAELARTPTKAAPVAAPRPPRHLGRSSVAPIERPARKADFALPTAPHWPFTQSW
jgi:hypothetical protein